MNDCALCEALNDEEWLAFYAGLRRSWAILKTKNMKGHSKRCMIVMDHHTEMITQADEDEAHSFLFNFITTQHRDHDWTIMETTHATIPEHFHLVASTLDEGDDQDLIADTYRIEIRFKRRKN